MIMVTRNLGVEQDKIKSAIVKRLFKNVTSLKENKQRIVILKTLLLKQTRQPNGYKIMTLIINCIVNKSLRIGLIDMFKRNQLHVLCQEEVDIPQVFGWSLNIYVLPTQNGHGTAYLWRKCLNVLESTAVVVNRVVAIELEDYFFVNVYALSGRAK